MDTYLTRDDARSLPAAQPASGPPMTRSSPPGPRLGPRQPDRVFDSLAEGVWERNLITSEVWYSTRYKALLGFAGAELPNLLEAVWSRVHRDDLALARREFANAIERLGEAECTVRILTRCGQWRWFRARSRVWPDARGNAEWLIGTLADVHDERLTSERVLAERTVLEQRIQERTVGLEAALLEAERANRAKASFLAHMSHELRTPLNGVIGMNQLAQSRAVDAEQRRYLELAQQSSQTLLRILDDVLDFARVEAGRLQLSEEDVDLAQLATETLRSFMPDVRAKCLGVGFDYVGDITQVRADAGRLRQIISNLVSNAIKFTDHGHVTLIVEVTPVHGQPDSDGCRVRLLVRDSGIGMDEATAARVFEPFEQGDSASNRRHGGTGLGLPIVRLLARLMGGDVTMRHCEPGSELRVELNLTAQTEQPLRALVAQQRALGHAWVLMRSATRGLNLCKRLERIGWSVELMPDLRTATDRLRAGLADPLPGCVVISEDVLTPATQFALLRQHLPPGVAVTLLLRPDFALSTVHSATEQYDLKVLIAPLMPSDLYALADQAARAAGSADDRPAAGAVPVADSPCRVLIVEDNRMNQIIAREMVAALGLQPVVVSSGEEALLSCEQQAPDLVLMDIQMPGMDGLEATRCLRAMQASGELARFPILALTAHAMASDRQASLDAGLDEHLTKPVQLDALRRAIEQWLAAPPYLKVGGKVSPARNGGRS